MSFCKLCRRHLSMAPWDRVRPSVVRSADRPLSKDYRRRPPPRPRAAQPCKRASEGGTSTIIHPRSIHPFVPSSFISVRKNSARRRNHTRFRGRAPRPPLPPTGDPCNLMMVFSKSGNGGAVQRRCFHPLERLFVSKNSNNPFLRHSLSGGRPRRGRRKMGS